MIEAGTFKHIQYRDAIHCQHYDLGDLCRNIIYGNYKDEAWPYMSVFGVKPRGGKFTPGNASIEAMTNEVAIAIDESLAGKRPDLATKIWSKVLEITGAENRKKNVSKHDIMLLEDMGIDLGAALMLVLIKDIADGGSDQSRLELINHGGTKSCDLSISYAINLEAGIRVENYHLSRQVKWNGDCLSVPRLPHTIGGQLADKRLGELITHPFLDPLDLRITRVRHGPHNDLVYTNYEPDHIKIADLASKELAKAYL